MIGASQLARMKRDAVLINTARGALVDAAALADALRGGRLGGAAIDVLSQEPPVDGNPLLAGDIPNLIVTPHIAWAAREARQRCIDEMAANVADFRRGGRRGRVVWNAGSGRCRRSGQRPALSAFRYPLSAVPEIHDLRRPLSTGRTRGDTSSIASSKLTQRYSLCSGRPSSGIDRQRDVHRVRARDEIACDLAAAVRAGLRRAISPQANSRSLDQRFFLDLADRRRQRLLAGLDHALRESPSG